MEKEKRKQWGFRMNKNNSWSWHVVHADATERSSDMEFETLAQCIVDAKEHGYVVWNAAEERRRNRPKPAMQ